VNFLIVTHVVHTQKGNDYFAYSPYVNEMNIWLKYVDKVTIIAPLKAVEMDAIYQKYHHPNIHFITVPEFSFINKTEMIKAVFVMPYIFLKLFWAMLFAHHIHLRCPGNMGLLGSFVQLFFPWKKKSAKYAGNWDANSKQPLSYRMQKKILSSTFLTHRIKVLVYGEWKNQSKNIKSFFTATYFDSEIKEVPNKDLNGKIKFIFVGTLSEGKRPHYAIQLVEELKKLGFEVTLSLYGSGSEQKTLERLIEENGLSSYVFLKGNTDRASMITIYQEAHFMILPSKSEGWPKVVAEAMFWGCLPIATQVSCVPTMLDFGKRGILLTEKKEEDVKLVEAVILNLTAYHNKIDAGMSWSRNFTIDKFESEIQTIIRS
jgi:glycosyltransferase involved in cell wall biosynthesis